MFDGFSSEGSCFDWMGRKYFQRISPVKDNILHGLERLEGICKIRVQANSNGASMTVIVCLRESINNYVSASVNVSVFVRVIKCDSGV